MQPGDEISWYFRGALIAIAIDVGMLVSSRSLVHSKSRLNTLVLSLAFAIAAISSFYSQVTYVVYHTPFHQMSDGVSEYWKTALQPLIDARVVILPFMLPLLATVYTLARAVSHKPQEATKGLDHSRGPVHEPVHVDVRKPAPIEAPEERPLLASGELPDGLQSVVDWGNMTFYDDVSDSWKGPFKSEKALVSRYKGLQTLRERKGLPKYAKKD